MSEATERG